ncbi:MAG: MlaD family protein [Pirellulales bacterium]|nr:MlaD family protein [Pirellulales bacterium]
MNERALQIRVGFMVLTSMIIGAVLIVVFAELPTFGKKVTIEVDFDDATGVAADTPVYKSGKLIGRVTDVELKAIKGVRVTMNIEEDAVRENDEARVVGSLLGDASISFMGRDQAEPAPPIQPGTILRGNAASDPLAMMSEISVRVPEMTESVTKAGDAIDELAKRINKMLGENDDQFGRIVNKSETALDNFNKAMMGLNDVFGDEQSRERLQQGLEEIPEVLKKMSTTLDGVQRTIRLADSNLRNLEGFTKPLGERGEKIAGDLSRATDLLDDLLSNVVQFSDALNRREGTLGQLVHNRELYDRLNGAAKTIDDLVKEVRPIVRDMRVFSDKLARNPELLGVRGAVKPSNGTKYPDFSRPRIFKPVEPPCEVQPHGIVVP